MTAAAMVKSSIWGLGSGGSHLHATLSNAGHAVHDLRYGPMLPLMRMRLHSVGHVDGAHAA
jgi:hypothetical protein